MFSRFLGQSLGIAVFGTLFNGSLAAQLVKAPSELRARLPQDIDNVVISLQQSDLATDVALYLRHSVFDAIYGLYMGLAVVAALVFMVVVMSPREFNKQEVEPVSESV